MASSVCLNRDLDPVEERKEGAILLMPSGTQSVKHIQFLGFQIPRVNNGQSSKG